MRNLLAALLALVMTHSAQATPMSDDWWNDSVFYEIFTRSFQDSNGDGIGDLPGITSRLDYLASLGVGGIWLTPIFPSPSYHGYDATDYTSIHPDFGSLEDFKRLLAEAHQRGIKVILDIAINHSSDRHPWFKERRDYYCWRERDPVWPGKTHWYPRDGAFFYGFFSSRMPDLDWNNPSVVQEVKSLLRYWVELGVDGFRLDAPRYYVEGPRGESDTAETHRMIQDFVKDIKSTHPSVYFVGEVWADAKTISSYLKSGTELDQAFHFPAAYGMLESIQQGKAAPFANSLRESLKRINTPARLAPFITNHDMVRVASQLGPNLMKLKLAATTMLTLPGTPFLYYGEEIGLPNSSARSDLGKRTPMQWTGGANHGFAAEGVKPWLGFASLDPGISVDAQQGVVGTLQHYYERLIHLRNREASLRRGNLQLLSFSNPGVLAYARNLPDESAIVIFNFSGSPARELVIDLGSRKKRERDPSLAVLWGQVAPYIEPGSKRLKIRVPVLPHENSAIIKVTAR